MRNYFLMMVFVGSVVAEEKASSPGDVPLPCYIPRPLVNGRLKTHPIACANDSGDACRLLPGTEVYDDRWPLLYECHEGFVQTTDYGVSLCRRGLWSPRLPTCQPTPSCGKSQIQRAQSSSAAQQSQPGDIPWFSVLAVKNTEKNIWEFRCVGILISRRLVLTGGRCAAERGKPSQLYSADQLAVYLGKTDMDVNNRDDHALRVSVEAVHRHPNFTVVNSGRDYYLNTLTVFELREEVPTSDHVLPVCVDTADLLDHSDHRDVYIAGYSWKPKQCTSIGGSPDCYNLQYVVGQVSPTTSCEGGENLAFMHDSTRSEGCVVSNSTGSNGLMVYGFSATTVVDGRHYLRGLVRHTQWKDAVYWNHVNDVHHYIEWLKKYI